VATVIVVPLVAVVHEQSRTKASVLDDRVPENQTVVDDIFVIVGFVYVAHMLKLAFSVIVVPDIVYILAVLASTHTILSAETWQRLFIHIAHVRSLHFVCVVHETDIQHILNQFLLWKTANLFVFAFVISRLVVVPEAPTVSIIAHAVIVVPDTVHTKLRATVVPEWVYATANLSVSMSHILVQSILVWVATVTGVHRVIELPDIVPAITTTDAHPLIYTMANFDGHIAHT
jgi:hypothetical protein